MLVINFKNYVFGDEAVKLARICKRVNRNIILGVGISDLYRIVKNTGMKCFVQHVDYYDKGRNTGFVLPESVKSNGGKGVFLNHSEHRLKFDDIKKTVERCKKLKLETMIFAKDINGGKKLEKLKPDYIVIEPPNLIAGKVSVSEANPKLIKNAVSEIRSKILVGAGIRNREDVDVARKSGAKGVLVSSAVTTAKNPENVLRELI